MVEIPVEVHIPFKFHSAFDSPGLVKVFLDTKKTDKNNKHSYFFSNPKKIIETKDINQVREKIREIELEVNEGSYAAGFISYEAFLAFEKIPKVMMDKDFSLLKFAIFKKPLILESKDLDPGESLEAFKLKNISPELTKKEFAEKFHKIKEKIRLGETFQTNFSFKTFFDLEGDFLDFYLSLRGKQSVSFSSLLEFEDLKILSFSPELFFRIKNGEITMKPMKGTISRGINSTEDQGRKKALQESEKDLAENSMIIDLIRNDLGKIAEISTVKPRKMFELEKYETLFQMTSEVTARLKKNVSLEDIVSALFPCGSVTGAPKIRTMEIISSLEKSPRKVYCGAIGFFSKKESCFSVPIRTISLNLKSKKGVAKYKGEMGIGSGIVWDSDCKKEYQECMLKSRFLTIKEKKFSLIESFLLEDRKFYLEKLHLDRLTRSADYFSFKLDRGAVKKELNKIKSKAGRHKVRLLLEKSGKISLSSEEIFPDKVVKNKKVAISKLKINSEDIFLYHKTTIYREIYDEEFKKYSQKFFSLLFLNTKNELTEAAAANIFIEKNTTLFTPPVSSGLLPGTFREELIKKGKCQEKILKISDLKTADKVFLGNSVRGLMEVNVEFKP